MLEDGTNGRLRCRAPADLALRIAAGNRQVMLFEEPHSFAGRFLLEGGLENKIQSTLDFNVGMLEDPPCVVANQPGRQRQWQFSPLPLMKNPGRQSGAKGVKLQLRNLAFQAQEHPAVDRTGVVDAVTVGDQAASIGAEIQQLVPVGTVPRQSCGVVGQDDANPAEAHIGHELLETAASFGSASRSSHVGVNDADIFGHPTQLDRSLPEPILHLKAFLIRQRLVRTGLADIYHGLALDNIPHAVIMRGLSNVVADGNVLGIVERFLRAGVMEDGVIQSTTVGTPQGGVLSALLANVALNFLDWELDRRGFGFVRYADDFIVLFRSPRRAQEARQDVEKIVSHLGLTLSPEKTDVTEFRRGFVFLGFRVTSWGMTMRPKSVERFKTRIRELTRRSHNLDARVVAKLNTVVQWGSPVLRCRVHHLRVYQFRKRDEWLRMRLRCMRHKRKSDQDNRRMPIRHLRRRGVLFLSDFLPSPGKQS